MSIWTYVDATFKGEFDVERAREVVGYEINWEDDLDEWDRKCSDRREHPERYLPMGSEGTLRAVIEHDRITVHGALRGFSNHHEIWEWFDRVCMRLRTERAKCKCVVDCMSVHTWRFKS